MTRSIEAVFRCDDASVAEAVSAYFASSHEDISLRVCTDRALTNEDFATVDCVIVDGDLTDPSAIEILRQLRAEHELLPIVYLCTDCSPARLREALSAGIMVHVPREAGQTSFPLLADVLQDITERMRAQRRSVELEQVNRVIRAVDQALVRSRTREEIDRRICEIMTDRGPFQFAWIGEPDPETETVTVRAAAGAGEGYLDDIEISTDGEPTAMGPTGRALQTGTIQVASDIEQDDHYGPWREAALERGFRSSIAIPLVHDGESYGVANFYAGEPYSFGHEERTRLADLGNTIAYALAEVALREDLRRFERAIEHAADAIFITDRDGVIQYVNPAFEELTGYNAAEAVGNTPRILQSGQVSEEYYERMWETILAGEVWQAEIVDRTNSGEIYEADQTVAPIFDEAGDIEGFVAIQRDITERKRREEELAANERRLRTLFDCAPDGIIVHDEDGEVLDVNRTQIENLGYDREELLGMNVSDFEIGIDTDVLHDRWRSIEPGVLQQVEVEGVHRRRDGSTYPVEVYISRLETPDEEDRLVAHVRDVTERQQRIRQLRVLDRVLRHNLQNEMAVIRGYAQEIQEMATDAVAEYATEIVWGSDQLLRTVRKEREVVDLLSSPADPVEIDLSTVIDRVVDGVAERHPEAVITVSVPDSVAVEATKSVDRALEELLDNAIEHADRDPPTVTIDVTESPTHIQLSVADTGPGIPEEEVRVLTGREEIDPLYHGSGLGLWLIYWIVERSNATVEFQENEPRGSLVSITFRRPSM